MHILPCPEQKRDSEGIQRTSCLPILQVHLLISSHSWIKRIFWWHFLLNTAASYTHAARISKRTACREWSTISQSLLGLPPQYFPCSAEAAQCQRFISLWKPGYWRHLTESFKRELKKHKQCIHFSKILATPHWFSPFSFYLNFCPPAATALTRPHTIGTFSTGKSQYAHAGLYLHWVRDFQLVAQK